MTSQHIDKAALIDEVQQILVGSAGVDKNELDRAADTALAELGLDSLAAMELQAVVKNRYGVRIPDETLQMTVPEIAAHIEEQAREGE
jgi:acyl carrier protein